MRFINIVYCAFKLQVLCKIIAITLHFFLLSTFSWMLMEGFHLYLLIISVFNTSSKLKFYYLFGWGKKASLLMILFIVRLRLKFIL